ncbi:hypothetical protein KUF57_12435 [Mycolicibacterium sp. PAM1]|uniref:Transmembrane protein n=1 Tax=Mycolicibacterium gilvum (strain PYR-GCK) TaxID=350054 RepID=A4TBM1_MYCGI|nr:hypothetical protein [Mycolicibacterium sp. PAM1]ABP45392.1 hypothetical protein Mflv_2915 [Mycolicibacterium gilvum PYR-GCK]MBV5244342.1 hypothetical protein [Mycolicibacterium sp. PAM1]
MRALIAGLWAAAVGLAGFAVYCLARALGLHPQMGTVGECLAAIFTAGATGAALYIATRDRQERSKERLAADEAQAKLVMVTRTFDTERYPPDTAPLYEMSYRNHGEHPILDVRLVKIEMRAFPTAKAELPDFTNPIVEAGASARGAGALFLDAEGNQFPPPKKVHDHYNEWPDADELDVVGWIRFRDINGNLWAKSSDHQLIYLRNESDVQHLP